MALVEVAKAFMGVLRDAHPASAIANVVVSKKGQNKNGTVGPAQICKRIVLSRLAQSTAADAVPEVWSAWHGETFEYRVKQSKIRFTLLLTTKPQKDFWTNVTRAQLKRQRENDAVYLALWNRTAEMRAFCLMPDALEAGISKHWKEIAKDRCRSFVKQFSDHREKFSGLVAKLNAELGPEDDWQGEAESDRAEEFLNRVEKSLADWIEAADEKADRENAKKLLLDVVRKVGIHVESLGTRGFKVLYNTAFTLYEVGAAQGLDAVLQLNSFESALLKESFLHGGIRDVGAAVAGSIEGASITEGVQTADPTELPDEIDAESSVEPETESLTSLKERVEATQKQLEGRFVGVNSESILTAAWAALMAGKHLVLTGAPGTAKTTLALAIADVARRAGMCTDFLFTTATTDWTSLDTVGGYVPNSSGGGLVFQPGKFLQCLRKDGLKENKWLVIDELNRADVDKAFGQFFTVLSGHQSELPYRDGVRDVLILCESDEAIAESEARDARSYAANEYLIFRVPREWRMIGTLNTADKASLYEMSFAFMRRFAFVHVPLPKEDGLKQICSQVIVAKVGLAQARADTLIDLWSRISRVLPLGPSIVIDMARYLKARSPGSAKDEECLSEAIAMYLVPHLEGADNQQLNAIKNLCADRWTESVKLACIAFVPAAREAFERTESNRSEATTSE